MYDSQAITVFSLCDTLKLSTDTCEGGIVLWEVREAGTDWTPSRFRDCLDPQKSLTSWSTWSTALNPGSGRAENQKHDLWEPTGCVITEQLF